MNGLEGKVAIVTGGNSGFGQATSLAFARQGVRVVIAARSQKKADETLRMIDEAGSKGVFIPTDLTETSQVEALVAGTVEVFGRLDFGVNIAGIAGVIAPTSEYPEKVFNELIAINLTAVWLSMKYELRQMVKQGWGGAIVNMSGTFGLIGAANIAPYSATRHAVLGLTKSAALEYVKQGIRINAVCPGACKTPMLDAATGANPEVEAQWASFMPIGRLGIPAEIADAIVWLCSDNSSFVVGHALAVDGGWAVQ
jgi:NAD(P)-dependent dehydrogenase (short-subunit alcohol dehydrogenase family)